MSECRTAKGRFKRCPTGTRARQRGRSAKGAPIANVNRAIAAARTVQVHVEAGNGLTFAVSKSSARASGIAEAPQNVVNEGNEICGYDSHNGATLWCYRVADRRLLIG